MSSLGIRTKVTTCLVDGGLCKDVVMGAERVALASKIIHPTSINQHLGDTGCAILAAISRGARPLTGGGQPIATAQAMVDGLSNG